MDITKTASGQTPIALSGVTIRTQADWDQYINTFYDNLVDEIDGEINENALMGFFRENTQTKDVEITKTKVKGNAVAKINEDGSPISFVTWGQGWAYSWYVYPYRIGVRHTRHLEEIEDFGEVAQEGMEIKDASSRTIKFALADVFNRGVAPGSGAPFLCYDGMYLIDGARPNPVIGTPDWDNEETTGDLTEDLLFTASQNTENMKAHNGDELNLSIQEILIPRTHDQVMWKLWETPKEVGNAQNTHNWAAGRFQYQTVREFTGNTIYYRLGNPKSDDNGLQIRWAVRPGVADINFEDPDIMGKRMRFRFGLGCLDPRKMWRGGMLNAV